MAVDFIELFQSGTQHKFSFVHHVFSATSKETCKITLTQTGCPSPRLFIEGYTLHPEQSLVLPAAKVGFEPILLECCSTANVSLSGYPAKLLHQILRTLAELKVCQPVLRGSLRIQQVRLSRLVGRSH